MADTSHDELRVRLQNLEAKQKTFSNGLGLPILLGICASVVLFSGWLGAAEKVRWIPLICIFLVITNFINILLRWHAQYVELQVLRALEWELRDMGGHTKVAIPASRDERPTFPAALISEEQTTLQGGWLLLRFHGSIAVHAFRSARGTMLSTLQPTLRNYRHPSGCRSRYGKDAIP